MVLKSFYIENISEGNNSVLFQTPKGNIFYEKLTNTLHFGGKELKDLQNKVEQINYNPFFESESLKKRKGEKLESLLLNVTESCNLSCSYCIYSGNYENERNENNLNMDFKTAKKAIDLFMPQSRNPALISFYGGEPLNNIELIKEIIKYSKKMSEKMLVFSMTSNFYNADKYIREIVENEIYVNISLDGPREIHDKNRKFKDGRSTYNKTIENLGKFEEFAPEYAKNHFRYNVTCKNPKDLPAIIKFFQEQDQFLVSRINMVESKGLKKEIKNPDSSDVFNFISDYLISILSKKDPGILRRIFDNSLKNIVMRSTEVIPKKLMLNGCCYPGNRKLFVDTDGQFFMCEKFGRRVAIGDINKGIDQELINDAISKFLNIRNNYCTDGCWAQRLCNSCIQSSKDPTGDISERGLAQTCESNKSQILIALNNYVILVKENKKLFEDYVNSIQLK